MTALAEKLRSAGVNPAENDLMIALSRYLNAGGTLERLREIIAGLNVPSGKRNPSELRSYESRISRRVRLEPEVAPLREFVRSKFKTSDGIAFSDVSIHAGMGIERDGAVFAALNAALPGGLPNKGQTYGEVFGVKRVDEIAAKALG